MTRTAAKDLPLLVFLWKVAAEYEIQRLCKGEIARRYDHAEVAIGDELPTRSGGLRLFTPSAFRSLRR